MGRICPRALELTMLAAAAWHLLHCGICISVGAPLLVSMRQLMYAANNMGLGYYLSSPFTGDKPRLWSDFLPLTQLHTAAKEVLQQSVQFLHAAHV